MLTHGSPPYFGSQDAIKGPVRKQQGLKLIVAGLLIRSSDFGLQTSDVVRGTFSIPLCHPRPRTPRVARAAAPDTSANPSGDRARSGCVLLSDPDQGANGARRGHVASERQDVGMTDVFGRDPPLRRGPLSLTWRLADLFDKHHFLLNGLGWGGMPLHAVRKDLDEGRLSVLPIEDVPPDGLILAMSVVWQTKSPPGPAGRWFIDRLKQIPVETGKCRNRRSPGKRRGGLRKLSQTSVSYRKSEVRGPRSSRTPLDLELNSSTASRFFAPQARSTSLGRCGGSSSVFRGRTFMQWRIPGGKDATDRHGTDRQYVVISAPSKQSCPAQGLPPRPAGRGASEAYCGHDRQSPARPARWQRLRAAALQ